MKSYIDTLSSSELIAFKNIIESKMNTINGFRERGIEIDFTLYEKLQEKRNKLEFKINNLIDLI